jgi:PAS domain S-box-containing protein
VPREGLVPRRRFSSAEAVPNEKDKQAERGLTTRADFGDDGSGVLRAIVEGTSDAVFAKDLEGRYVLVNSAFADFIGKRVEEILGRRDEDLYQPETAARFRREDAEVLRAGGTLVFEGTASGVGGRQLYRVTKGVVHDAGGAAVGVFGISHDMTERRRAEEERIERARAEAARAEAEAAARSKDELLRELRESEERYRSLLENANDIIYSHDFEGRYLTINRACEEVTGYTREEILSGLKVSQVVAPEHLELARLMTEKKLRDPSPTVYEIDILTKDGRRLTLEVSTRISYRGGRPVAVEGIARDVTDRKRIEAERQELLERERAARAEAERRLRESVKLAELYRDLARSLELPEVTATICRAVRELVGAEGAAFIIREGDEVYYADTDAVAPLWKGRRFPAAACVSGWSIIERQPAVIEDIYADARVPVEAYRPTFVKSLAMVPVRATGPVGAIGAYWAERHRASEDEVRLLQALASAADLAFSNAQLYEQAVRARREAEEANRLKDEFLATLSHELRTPLTSILGWAHMLHDGALDAATQRNAVGVIRRNAEHQKQLVDDILDASRIIAGKLKVEVEQMRLMPVVFGAVDAVRPAAAAKGVEIACAFDPGAEVISGDPHRLQQVVWNLLSNAVKFTPAGGRVKVTVERLPAYVRIAVSDTGEGIGPEFLPHVFERFRQGDGSTTRRHGGLGLGLSIVRYLVEAHGGAVHAHSAGLGHGATFTVDLPLADPQAQTRFGEARGAESIARRAATDGGGEGDVPPALVGVRVLVVDDDGDALALLALLLENNGAEVLAVGTASAALEALGRFRPDVIVSDIGMPGGDGFELLKRVRALDRSRGGAVPALALTAYASEVDRERALAAGFHQHLAKPADPQELIASIAALAGRAAAARD